MLLYIIRHGDPIYSNDTLTERGQLQALAVGKRMYDAKIDKIFTSPMGRARLTAEPAARMLGIEPVVENWAREIGSERLTPYPDGKKKTISELPNTVFRKGENLLLSYEDTYKCTAVDQTNMRSAVEAIEKNGDEFLERLGYKKENGVYRILRPNEEKVALFCHGAFGRAWLSTLLHIPVHMMWASFDITHTGVTILDFQNYEDGYTAPRCLCFSDMSHLYAEGLDMIYDDYIDVGSRGVSKDEK